MQWQQVIPGWKAAAQESAKAETAMDHDAFTAFYERNARSLWGYLARVSANPTLADDLTQEAFVRFLCANQPEGEVAQRKYLFRIGTNLMHDHWRGAKTASLEEMPEEMFATQDDAAGTDARMMLAPALKKLRPRDREILWLAHAEGYTHDEIAEITGVGSASLRIMLFRARRKMAPLLTPSLTAKGGAR